MSTNLTTELEAVNSIISITGQLPINSLSEARADTKVAQSLLKEVSRELQSEGWNFNTEIDLPLTPDGNNEIVLPTNLIRFEVNPEFLSSFNPVFRNGKLYDTKNRSYSFSKTLKGTAVYFLDFANIPEAARRYIILKTTRLYQQRYVGSGELRDSLARDEAEAKAAFLRHDYSTGNHNYLTNNQFIPRGKYRRYGY